jgi:hypothetical protein
MIIGISSNNAFNHVAPKRTGDGLALVPLSSGEKVSEGPPQQSSISILARQLGESAARAELRDGQLDRRQLGMEAERLLSQILGDIYQAEKTSHNQEVPETDNPELLDRARKATEYVVRSDQHDRNVVNPFVGLSREQLNLIVYDDKGSYTINERRAAWYGVSNIEARWNRRLMHESDIESAMKNGRTPNFYAEVIAHYKSLPLIEQAQYPEDYEAKRLVWIQEDSSPWDRREPKFLTLFEMLEIMLQHKKRDPSPDAAGSPGIDGAMGNVTAAIASAPADKA